MEVAAPLESLIVAYVIAVALNRLFNLFWWCATLKRTPAAYYREHGFALAATLILHVPAFVLWWSGAILPTVNAAIAGALVGLNAIPGVELAGLAEKLPTEVTALNTLCYGWPLDSLVSRVGMKAGSMFAIFRNGKEKP